MHVLANKVKQILRAGARTLHAMPPVPGDRPRGLYVGDMGVVVALLRAGQVLQDGELLCFAAERAGQERQRQDHRDEEQRRYQHRVAADRPWLHRPNPYRDYREHSRPA